ncbi:hypothetical protein [Geomobilimonas luticola]|uniref:DUF3836 domain-containing protein n=1 Tax=Geomobilimonas luticola TaxID=1114878 RepID=A0ABS5SH80_9BACT|nr:hypothetical protein [Geomobilimonas luticola]MBT0653911.1 hypothetical protein [Geomobilimonas luticola]
MKTLIRILILLVIMNNAVYAVGIDGYELSMTYKNVYDKLTERDQYKIKEVENGIFASPKDQATTVKYIFKFKNDRLVTVSRIYETTMKNYYLLLDLYNKQNGNNNKTTTTTHEMPDFWTYSIMTEWTNQNIEYSVGYQAFHTNDYIIRSVRCINENNCK